MPCSHCETIPALPAAADLYLAPSPQHVAAKVRHALAAYGCTVDDVADGTMRTDFNVTERAEILDALSTALSEVETAACQALVLPHGQAPGLGQLMRMTTLGSLIAKQNAAWLGELLEEKRLVTHFQPIIAVDAPDAVFAQECLTRGVDRDGALIPPGMLFDAARSADLLYHLDRAARIAAIENAVLMGGDARIFINFIPTSIYDPKYCLETTMRAAAASSLDPARIVFEVVESDEVTDVAHLLRIVETYRAAGCLIALDDFGAGYSSLDLLGQLRPDFVKFDRGLLFDVTRDTFRGELLSSILKTTRELGIKSIVEGVETQEDWDWIRGQEVDYAQGFFIAKPASPPAEPWKTAPRPANSQPA